MSQLPPFNGKEEWKVWLNRFEAVANRRRWNNEAKLDNLLPRLQGKAGEFVFSQLSQETLSSYDDLVKELNSRFRVVETQRAFAAKFSQRTQKPGETVEEYAAELKRLYAKAHQYRDATTRQEDLVRRFLDGLRDEEARFEIEFHKEPEDIDKAVYHAVNYIQSKRRSESYLDKKAKKYARRTSEENDSGDELPETWYDTDDHKQAKRVPVTRDENPKKKAQGQRFESKPLTTAQKSTPETESMKVLTETKELMQTLVSQIAELKKPGETAQDQQKKQQTAQGGITCYSCHLKGHFSCDCPEKVQKGQNNNRPTGQGKKQNPLN